MGLSPYCVAGIALAVGAVAWIGSYLWSCRWTEESDLDENEAINIAID